jgi:RNA polymerase sigma-70 factor (ECF subfamily)
VLADPDRPCSVDVIVHVGFDASAQLPMLQEVHRSLKALCPGVHSLEYRPHGGGSTNVYEAEERLHGEDAFARYVLPELEVLARVAFSITRNSADAEDLVQETLLCAYRAIDRFDGAHPRAWLFTIMRNAEAKRHRRRRPQLLRDPGEAGRLESTDPRETVGSPEDVVVGAEFRSVVAQCLASLPARHRQVVELIDVDGLSYAEAAEAIGVPVGTVMSRLHRARIRIRLRLGAAGLAPKRSMR